MNKRTISMIQILNTPEKNITIADLAEEFKVSQRTIRNDLNGINELLRNNGLAELPLKSGGKIIRVPEVLNQYVNDYKIHVFEISWLTDEQVEKFQSDFRIVAEYFTQIRKNDEYKPSEQEIRHVDEVLKLLAVFGGVSEADKLLKSGNTKGVKTMSNVFGRMVEKGKAEKLLAHVEMLKNKLNLSLDEALETLGETQEEYENAKSFMQ